MNAQIDWDLPTAPSPSPSAKDRAVGAALQRFDRRPLQPSGALARPRSTAGRRGFLMSRHRAALAASVAILVGGPLTYMLAREHGAPPVRTAEQGRRTEPVIPAPDLPQAPSLVEAQPRQDAPASKVAVGVGSAAPTGGAADSRSLVPSIQPAGPAGTPRLYLPPAPPRVRVAPLARESALARPSLPTVAAPSPLPLRQAYRSTPTGGTLDEPSPAAPEPTGRDRFPSAKENGFQTVTEQPVSTFSIDVDTASYSFARASLARNVLPQPAAVRTEEMINYFPYAYPVPKSAEEPFATDVAVFPSPWNEGRKIVRIGIKGYAIQATERPRANLVFLIDTSGSMNAPNRLPLVKQSLAMLLDKLDARDRVAIVTYAGEAGTALEPTPASEKGKILAVLDNLESGGSTAGGEGIRQAYSLAERNFDGAAVNRVVLATDGDFNVGITSEVELKGYIERERGKGIFLSVLGFGMGNYNDALMQELAQNGNGAAAYIDTLGEARKVLVEEATSTLIPIAKDVKIQVEFNPATVAEYRLVGYETRLLAREDFANDKVDAGDVGSGQSVTALYEIVPAGGASVVGDLRYGPGPSRPAAAGTTAPDAGKAGEYGFVKIRYKLPKSDTSTLISTPIARAGEVARFEDAPPEARFATAVAGFGEMLRGGRHTGRLTYDDVIRIAQGARGGDPYGYRAEFLNLVRTARNAAGLPKLRR